MLMIRLWFETYHVYYITYMHKKTKWKCRCQLTPAQYGKECWEWKWMLNIFEKKIFEQLGHSTVAAD